MYRTTELNKRFTRVSLPTEEVRGALSGPQCGQKDQIEATPGHFTLVTHLVLRSESTAVINCKHRPMHVCIQEPFLSLIAILYFKSPK